MLDISSTVFTCFTVYQFVLCYCVPLVSISFFYTRLLSKLREHARQFKACSADRDTLGHRPRRSP